MNSAEVETSTLYSSHKSRTSRKLGRRAPVSSRLIFVAEQRSFAATSSTVRLFWLRSSLSRLPSSRWRTVGLVATTRPPFRGLSRVPQLLGMFCRSLLKHVLQAIAYGYRHWHVPSNTTEWAQPATKLCILLCRMCRVAPQPRRADLAGRISGHPPGVPALCCLLIFGYLPLFRFLPPAQAYACGNRQWRESMACAKYDKLARSRLG